MKEQIQYITSFGRPSLGICERLFFKGGGLWRVECLLIWDILHSWLAKPHGLTKEGSIFHKGGLLKGVLLYGNGMQWHFGCCLYTVLSEIFARLNSRKLCKWFRPRFTKFYQPIFLNSWKMAVVTIYISDVSEVELILVNRPVYWCINLDTQRPWWRYLSSFKSA